MSGRAALLAALAASTVALAACGDDPTPDPTELVERLAEHGATLELGERLTSIGGAAPVYEIHFEGAEAGDAHRAGSGSLIALGEDEDAAAAEYATCEGSLLVCYRAGNNVLTFAEITPAQQAQLAAALKALAE